MRNDNAPHCVFLYNVSTIFYCKNFLLSISDLIRMRYMYNCSSPTVMCDKIIIHISIDFIYTGVLQCGIIVGHRF